MYPSATSVFVPYESQFPFPVPVPTNHSEHSPLPSGERRVPLILVLLPLLIVLSTLLFLVLVFLIGIIYVRRRKGIRLVEDGGPLDLSRNDGVIGEGGIAGVEARWLEGVSPEVAEGYKRGKDYQEQYTPNSVPSDITLSQFLSIQEKGVSAWCFEPDYESNLSLYVESRTEITFLADGPGMAIREGGGNTVLANLPIPKLNEVYYWEAKMYEKPAGTEVVVGLATKPYPSFRLPGWNKVSIGYFSSDGFKCHNYPFTASSLGPPLAEGDVLGVGYRPRTGTVFFTRNGKKFEDSYTGLNGFNLFPAIGANGACSVHVNLGQSGFVFIEANVKKWGLAPMIGTLAPPPAYGSERGSILLEAGYGAPGGARNMTAEGAAVARHISAGADPRLLSSSDGAPQGNNPPRGSSSINMNAHVHGQGKHEREREREREQRRRPPSLHSSSIPARPSPLRVGASTVRSTADEGEETELLATPTQSRFRDNVYRDDEENNEDDNGQLESQETESSTSAVVHARYHSPSDRPELNRSFPSVVDEDADGEGGVSPSEATYSSGTSGDDDTARFDRHNQNGLVSSTELSPLSHNPPTPNPMDISLRSMHPHESSPSYFGGRAYRDRDEGVGSSGESGESAETIRANSDSNAHNASEDEEEMRRQRRQERNERREQRRRDREERQHSGVQTRLHQSAGGWAGSDYPPPGYSPLDPNVYSQGVPTDLPAEIISRAFEE